jgi:ubiquinol-cytochrome c reductase cytochrome c1 subunit
MGKLAFLLVAVVALASGGSLASTGPEPRFEHTTIDPRDLPSLQRGGRLFVNYCLNCHGAKYMRYNRLRDIGLTEQQIVDNLVLTGRFELTPSGMQFVPTKIGDTMQVAMNPADAKGWFGAPPPDLSVEARVRGRDWLYNYFLAFYRDPQSATGWNNLVFPNVGMPHVLWELSGSNRLVATEYKSLVEAESAAIAARGIAVVAPGKYPNYVVQSLALDTPGTMTPPEYRRAVADLVNFMEYIAEPGKLKRVQLGFIVLLFLGLLFACAYWLKRDYWKDLH